MERSVLLVDDDDAILRSVGEYLVRMGYVVHRAATADAALEAFHRESPAIVLLDLNMPDVEEFELLDQFHGLDAAVIMLTGMAEVETAVTAMQHGAVNFLTKPVKMPHLVAALEKAFDTVRLKREVRLLRSRHAPDRGLEALGVSDEMTRIAGEVQLIAPNESATVLITGESGTGKGFLARLIHDNSPRSDKPFVDVNCAGLSATFVESELFGHERGAFTDAKMAKEGLFEVAADGTVFLDEVGDLASEVQPKLLKTIESKAFRRMGGTREISVNTRLVAATNKNLQEEIASGSFREDLYYRLNVVPIHLPPIRDRSDEDRLALIRRLLGELSMASATTPELDSSALARVMQYGWPGNIREMRNVFERALILTQGETIGLQQLPVEIRGGRRATDGHHRVRTMSEVEKMHIERTLHFHKGNRTAAAKDLGISRATLINKIKAYSLEV